MIFKPRIFISSTLDKIEVRDEIKTHFESIGADVLLYEQNLTPSISNATYRQDIIDADFIIFIFDRRYGQQTDRGKSGTHEEWDIVEQSKIPRHVYISKDNNEMEEPLKEFIKRNINVNNVSYFLYTDSLNLLKRIKETSFLIASEITLYKLEHAQIPINHGRKICINMDSSMALKIIRPIEEIKRTMAPSIPINTDIIYRIMDKWIYPNIEKYGLFIDQNLNQLFNKLVRTYNAFRKAQNEIYYEINKWNLLLNSTNESIYVANLHIYPQKALEGDKVDVMYIDFIDAFENFKKYVIERNEELMLVY